MTTQRKSSVDFDAEGQIIIEERSNKNEQVIKKYCKGRFLGKGGFAKCYEITCLESKAISAAKVIPKSSLQKSRAKQKLMSEIKIHRSLHHQNVVAFQHFFEDYENVYILLEMCANQTMNELIRRRKRLTELEVQCYLLQILSALKFLHQHRVIHRDLKLGNLFLSDKMEIKLGDFGLATKLEFDGERKRTICGTPNYIAPEILEGKNGHSYEVDIWSFGVIAYTLLIGKPPFETNDVKTTYKRIKMNAYSFPEHVIISNPAKNLITKILNTDPTKRPTIDEILSHEFFNNGGSIPKLLPVSTLACPPSASYLRQFQPKDRDNSVGRSCSPKRFESTVPLGQNKNLLKERKDFINTDRASALHLQPQAATNVQQVGTQGVDLNNNQALGVGIIGTTDGLTGAIHINNDVANMISSNNFSNNILQQQCQNNENLELNKKIDNLMTNRNSLDKYTTTTNFTKSKASFDKLGAGITTQTIPTVGTDEGASNQLTGPEIYVKKWVDYSSKYGMGYLLSNSHAGVFFNDSTKIIFDVKTGKFEYIERRGADKQDIVTIHGINDYPKDLQKKVTLLQHFRSYLEGEDNKNKVLTQGPISQSNNIAPLIDNFYKEKQDLLNNIYVKKWLRTKHAIMFRLSNKVVQVIFQDQTEIILSSELKVVTYVNKKHERLTYPLTSALESSNQEMSKRLKYTKDILTHMLGQHDKQPNNPGQQQQQPQLAPTSKDLNFDQKFLQTDIQNINMPPQPNSNQPSSNIQFLNQHHKGSSDNQEVKNQVATQITKSPSVGMNFIGSCFSVGNSQKKQSDYGLANSIENNTYHLQKSSSTVSRINVHNPATSSLNNLMVGTSRKTEYQIQ